MNIYDKKYIKDYIKEQLRSFYEKHGWKHLEVFLEINVVRYKGFRVSVKFMDDRGEIKYIERFLPEFELERVFSKDIAITMFMDSIVSYVINEYGRIHPEGIYVRQIINEPIKPEDMSSDILKFFIK